jgi:hypothetical protein
MWYNYKHIKLKKNSLRKFQRLAMLVRQIKKKKLQNKNQKRLKIAVLQVRYKLIDWLSFPI